MRKLSAAVVWAIALTGVGLTALVACQKPQQSASPPPQPEVKQAPATPIAEKKAELGDDETWDPAWDGYIEKALSTEMVSDQAGRSVRRLCPQFTRMSEVDRRAFWAYFFQALAGAEAGLKPTTSVRHTEPEVAVKDDVTNRAVRSQGLLQLTYMDAKRYGCDFDWEHDKALSEKDPGRTILQPKNNLECGVKIAENQIITQHKPLLSSTSYWSPLRPGTMSYRVFAKQMANVPAACRVSPGPKQTRTAGTKQAEETAVK